MAGETLHRLTKARSRLKKAHRTNHAAHPPATDLSRLKKHPMAGETLRRLTKARSRLKKAHRTNHAAHPLATDLIRLKKIFLKALRKLGLKTV